MGRMIAAKAAARVLAVKAATPPKPSAAARRTVPGPGAAPDAAVGLAAAAHLEDVPVIDAGAVSASRDHRRDEDNAPVTAPSSPKDACDDTDAKSQDLTASGGPDLPAIRNRQRADCERPRSVVRAAASAGRWARRCLSIKAPEFGGRSPFWG